MPKLAVITGGTRGIGLCTARRLKAAGLDVLITGTQATPANLDAQEAPHYLYRRADFRDLNQVQHLADELRKLKPQVLVNNVGIERNSPFEDLSLHSFQEVINANLLAAFQLIQAVVPGMKSAGWGRIVNVTSVWAKVGKAHREAYGSSKFALEGLSASLADELVGHGILVNCVAPGFINIDATAALGRGPERNAHLASHVPIRRMGTPEEVASAIHWLASPECSYVSGQTIVVDGGFASSGSRSDSF